MIPFPTAFPKEEIGIVLTGLQAGKKKEVIQASWVILGFGLNLLVPDDAAAGSAPITGAVPSTIAMDPTALVAEIEKAVAPAMASPVPGAPENIIAIPWGTLIPIIAQLLLSLLAKKD